MAPPCARRSGRRMGLVMLIASLSTVLWLTAASPTFACSCVEAQPMATYGSAEHAIFSGTAGASDARGVPVRVALWFSGRGAAPIVYLAADSFGDGAGCGTSVPPAGTEWIWVTFLPEGRGDPVTGLCSPHGQLGTAEGDAMLAEAAATFGGVAPPGTNATDAPAAPNQTPLVPPEAATAIVLGTVGLGLMVLLAAVFVARRRLRVDD